jgi:hypothetical protein
MAWIAQKTRGTRLTIAGTDYSEALLEISVSDSSVLGSGIVSCSGSIKLAQVAEGLDIRDFTKTLFKRGDLVLFDVQNTNQTWARHPRGYLYVISSSFNPTANVLDIEVGCSLYLRSLSDKIDDLIHFTAIRIAEDTQTIAAISDAICSESRFLWQNNQGAIVLGNFFDGDGELSNKAAAAWISVGGASTLEASPLGVSTIPPDVIDLTYRWRNVIAPGAGGVDSETTESTYFLEHPANWMAETTTNGLTTIQTVKRNFTVTAIQSSTKTYEGPGGQVSYEYQERIGPAVELSGQYYSDLFEQCRGTIDWFENKGDPNHGCEPGGLQGVSQSYSTRTYVYGSGGEVLKTVEDQYRNKLSCAVVSNWRPGANYVDGNVLTVDWRTLPEDEFFLNQRVITTYEFYDDRTVQTTETWRSPCNCNNAGLDAGSIDATEGSKTVERRTSRSKLANPAQPDRVSSVDVAKVETGTLQDIRDAGSYLAGTAGAGPITMKTQVPAELNGPITAAATTAATFLAYSRNLLEGDASGIRIAEALRQELITGYVPGMPFLYWDPQGPKAIKLRMNATSWALNQIEALVSTDGIFIGFSDGEINFPSNVVGSNNPLPPSGSIVRPPGTPVVTPPVLSGQTSVDNGRAYTVVAYVGILQQFVIDLQIYTPPSTMELQVGIKEGIVLYGQLVGPEGVLATTEGVGLTLASSGGSLLTSAATVIDSDLFT